MSTASPGVFCVSLDFELAWGMHDKLPAEVLQERMLATRRVIPQLLQLFDDYGIRATWATVGLLMCRSADEARELSAGLPRYQNAALDAHSVLEVLEGGEVEHPAFFAPSLVEQIVATRGQELGCHTFGHSYALEAGADSGANLGGWEEDLRAFRTLAERWGVEVRSLVFPRNQVSAAAVSTAVAQGFEVWRGNPPGLLYRARPDEAQHPVLRAGRLAESLAPAAPARSAAIPERGVGESLPGLNVPATRFLRPWSPALRVLEPLKIARIQREIEAAARSGRMVHLWWHPHNFGSHTEQNLRSLHQILQTFARARRRWGMESRNMGDFVGE